MPGFDDLKRMADQHDDQVDQALEKVGDEVGKRFGHEEQVDKAVDQLQERTGEGDTTKD
jgi:hypothetical protein